MRGFIQIPIIIIILLISGGVTTTYIISQKTHPALQSVINQNQEASGSAKEAILSATPFKELLKNLPFKLGNTSSPKPSNAPSVTPSSTFSPIPSNSSTAKSFKSSSANVTLIPSSRSSTSDGSGQVSVELYANDPYYTTGKIASFRVNGTVSGLKSNTTYWLAFSPPNDPGGAVGVLDFTTNSSGDASLSVEGRGISYFPSNSNWSIGIYPKSDASIAVVKGSFSISDDTISANNPPLFPPSPTPTPNPYPNEVYINPPAGAKVYINYLSSNKATYGGSMIAKGDGFGSTPRWVRLINLTNPQIKEYNYTYLQGIISWQPNEVVFWVPADNGTYSLEIEGEGSIASNKVNLEVIKGSSN